MASRKKEKKTKQKDIVVFKPDEVKSNGALDKAFSDLDMSENDMNNVAPDESTALVVGECQALPSPAEQEGRVENGKHIMFTTFELNFRKKSNTSIQVLEKQSLCQNFHNSLLVISAFDKIISTWSLDCSSPDCNKTITVAVSREHFCEKCNQSFYEKCCGYLCGFCEFSIKVNAHRDEYKRLSALVTGGCFKKSVRQQTAILAKDCIKTMQHLLIPFLSKIPARLVTSYLVNKRDFCETWGTRLSNIWQRLQTTKLPIHRIKINQDLLLSLMKNSEKIRSLLLTIRKYSTEIEDLSTALDSMASIWDSDNPPIVQGNLEKWFKEGYTGVVVTSEVLEVLDLAVEADKSGERIDIVDLRCVDSFLSSMLSSMEMVGGEMKSVVSTGLAQKIDWTKETLSKAYCHQCRKVKLTPGDKFVHLSMCGYCKSVRYCGTDCQEEHWKSHKNVCENMKDEKENKKNMKVGRDERQKRKRFVSDVLENLFTIEDLTFTDIVEQLDDLFEHNEE